KENAFAAPDTHGVPESELAAVDGGDPVADIEGLFHAARERGAHCGFATCLQLRVGAGGCEEIHGHVASLAEEWLEFLECQENLAVVGAGVMRGVDVDGPHLAAVLAQMKVAAGAHVCVVEAKA